MYFEIPRDHFKFFQLQEIFNTLIYWRNKELFVLAYYFLFLQLLKIERVSETGVKQTCISDVNFAPLVAMPDSDSSLPKLFFPKENPKRREKVC